MNKWHGLVGFGVNTEIEPGIFGPEITERFYYGNILSNFRKTRTSGEVNDSLEVSNKISIISDNFSNLSWSAILYVEIMGAKWKVTDVEVAYPRLILTLGGAYNG